MGMNEKQAEKALHDVMQVARATIELPLASLLETLDEQMARSPEAFRQLRSAALLTRRLRDFQMEVHAAMAEADPGPPPVTLPAPLGNPPPPGVLPWWDPDGDHAPEDHFDDDKVGP